MVSSGSGVFNDGPSLLTQLRVIPGPRLAAHNDSRHDWHDEMDQLGMGTYRFRPGLL